MKIDPTVDIAGYIAELKSVLLNKEIKEEIQRVYNKQKSECTSAEFTTYVLLTVATFVLLMRVSQHPTDLISWMVFGGAAYNLDKFLALSKPHRSKINKLENALEGINRDVGQPMTGAYDLHTEVEITDTAGKSWQDGCQDIFNNEFCNFKPS